MICPKCGCELSDDSKFCSECGITMDNEVHENINEENLTNQTSVVQNEEGVVDAASEVQKKEEMTETLISDVSATDKKNDTVKKDKKKITGKKYIAIAIAIIVIFAVAFGVTKWVSSMGDNNAYVYLSDGKYKVVTNIEKNESIDIASSKANGITSDMLAFSPDEKYIYYYTKYDQYNETGTLCRAEYAKLKKDINKNDKYIEIIETNVCIGFKILGDGTVIFKNGNGTLCMYNGKETIQIAENIVNFYTEDSSRRIIYYTRNDVDVYDMYGVQLDDIDNKKKLASNYFQICHLVDFDNIVYFKNEDDNSKTLYVTGFDKDSEKLGEGIQVTANYEEKTYFTAKGDEGLKLSEFVEDTYADSDVEIKEPSTEEFSYPYYEYEMVRDYFTEESDYVELYTTCTQRLYFFGEAAYISCSMEEALNYTWGSSTDEVHVAVQNFIDNHASKADEEGYILVTEEVKADLKKIREAYSKYNKDWQWLWLCYDKVPSGTKLDEEAYNAAYEKWQAASDRIAIREGLQSKENEYRTYTLYCYENGNVTVIKDNILNARVFVGGILFNTKELITDKINIEEMSDATDVYRLFVINYESPNYVALTSTGEICQISEGAAQTITEAYIINDMSLYFYGDSVYLNEGDGALSVAQISDGVIDDTFTFIRDDAFVMTSDDDMLYYLGDYYDNNDFSYCNLYTYTNGTSTCHAKDIMYECINIYDDGVTLAYTGYRSYEGYELTMFNPAGESHIIDENVTQYIRVDKSNIMYIADGDLYLYNGKEKKMLQRDVEYLWCLKSMESVYTFGPGYFNN